MPSHILPTLVAHVSSPYKPRTGWPYSHARRITIRTENLDPLSSDTCFALIDATVVGFVGGTRICVVVRDGVSTVYLGSNHHDETSDNVQLANLTCFVNKAFQEYVSLRMVPCQHGPMQNPGGPLIWPLMTCTFAALPSGVLDPVWDCFMTYTLLHPFVRFWTLDTQRGIGVLDCDLLDSQEMDSLIYGLSKAFRQAAVSVARETGCPALHMLLGLPMLPKRDIEVIAAAMVEPDEESDDESDADLLMRRIKTVLNGMLNDKSCTSFAAGLAVVKVAQEEVRAIYTL
jgi:hypothetical protein